MKLWIITRLQDQEYNWLRIAVVRAETEQQARQITYVRDCFGCDERATDSTQYSCVELSENGNPEVICSDVLQVG